MYLNLKFIFSYISVCIMNKKFFDIYIYEIEDINTIMKNSKLALNHLSTRKVNVTIQNIEESV